MKKYLLAILFAFTLLLPGTVMAQLPGPVMAESASISQLPQKAQSFLNRYFNDIRVIHCEYEPGRGGGYEVDLANGVDIEFDSAGRVEEISCNDNQNLSSKVVKDILPVPAYEFLLKNSFHKTVTSIEMEKGQIEIGLTTIDPDKLVFNAQGAFVTLKRD